MGGGRGLLVVFLTRESAALVQAQGPSLFIIKSFDSLLVTPVRDTKFGRFYTYVHYMYMRAHKGTLKT